MPLLPLFQGTERDEILIGLRKRLGLPPLGSPHQQQHPQPGSSPNVRWHRPGEEVVKGAAVAPPPKSQGGNSVGKIFVFDLASSFGLRFPTIRKC